MKFLTVSAVALSVLGFTGGAQAQTGKLFFEGDIVRGQQPGAPGPFCVLNSQFKRLEKVVFRIRVLDQSGTSLDDKGLKSLMVLLPDGTKLPSYWGAHPPEHLKAKLGPTTDHFWTSAWIVPDKYPSGTFAYKIVATDMQGQSHTWEPFKNRESQFTIIAGAIEIKSK